MSAPLTSALLKRAARAAERQSELNGQLTDAFRARYGVTYSDLDLDPLIDALDYGLGGDFTLAEVDRLMTEAGHPPGGGNP